MRFEPRTRGGAASAPRPSALRARELGERALGDGHEPRARFGFGHGGCRRKGVCAVVVRAERVTVAANAFKRGGVGFAKKTVFVTTRFFLHQDAEPEARASSFRLLFLL